MKATTTPTNTPVSLEGFEAWLIEQQRSALGAMKAATGDTFTDACAAFVRPTAGIDALHAYRSHLARTPTQCSQHLREGLSHGTNT